VLTHLPLQDTLLSVDGIHIQLFLDIWLRFFHGIGYWRSYPPAADTSFRILGLTFVISLGCDSPNMAQDV